MKRRDMLGMMAGWTAAAAWGQAGLGAWQKSPDEMSIPELMKALTPMMGSIPVRATPLAPGLKLVTGPGGNVTAQAGPDGLTLVDSFVPGHVAALLAALDKPPAGKPITLIDTHWHFDHAGGNLEFGQLGAKIMAHATVRTRLGTDQNMVDLGVPVPASPAVALPVVTFDDQATLYQNGETIRLTHVPPAHTDGDIFIHYEHADVVQTGDLVSFGGYPNIDRSSRGWIGGMVAAVDILLGVVGIHTKVVPGHGPVGTKADLLVYRSMLAGVLEQVEPMLDAGKSLAEVIAAKPTAKFDPQWGQNVFRGSHFTTLAYNGLVEHRKEVAVGKR